MREAQKNYLVVGVFVLAMLGALLVWLAVLSGRTGMMDAYVIQYRNVMGLAEGAQILYEGFPVGRIEEISPARQDGRPGFRLDVSVQQGWEIPEDSVAQITRSGLLSAVVIDIQGGRSTRLLKPGNQIPSREATDVFKVLSSVASELGELAETSVKPLLANLTEGTSTFRDLAEDGPVIIDNLREFTVEINEASHQLTELIDKEGARVDRILVNFETTSSNVSAIARDLRQTRKRLDALLASMSNLISQNRPDIDQSVRDMQHTLEVLSRHVQDISYNLEATTRNMNEFSAQIRQDPGLIIRGRTLNADPAAGR